MKPIPRYDFPINIRPYACEVDKQVQPFYEGIIEVTLNFHIAVVFVPEIDKTVSCLRQQVPDNIDNVNSEREARLITIATEFYSVTPNLLLAGQEEVIPSSYPGTPDGLLFYVSPQEFNVFSQELTGLSQRIGRVYNSCKISDIKEYQLAKFILFRVITSRHFRSFDLQILGR